MKKRDRWDAKHELYVNNVRSTDTYKEKKEETLSWKLSQNVNNGAIWVIGLWVDISFFCLFF